uniref:LITAF domain-containing protein n=1 Tax=Parastrongyloides trichosuri TaxID=131310 RepID=A0A0N4ZKV6_PARTI
MIPIQGNDFPKQMLHQEYNQIPSHEQYNTKRPPSPPPTYTAQPNYQPYIQMQPQRPMSQPVMPTYVPQQVPMMIPMQQQQPNSNIVINNGNDNKNGKSPQQLAALLNMKEAKCPFCDLGVLRESLKYCQIIFFILISLLLFPFGLLIWICAINHPIYKKSCTNCGVEI